jgi:phospholipid/cholesterol/gamma-HCH transport system substrate-binding protein
LKITKEIKTAILVISSITLFIWGYGFLKGENFLNSHLTLFVEYENVEGLANGSAVTVSGKNIGKVKDITLNKNGKLLVEIQINDDEFPIAKSSIAQIYEPGFVGGKQIAIIPDYKDSHFVVSGDTLKSDIKQGLMGSFGDKLAPTQEKVNKLMADADVLLVNLNSVLDQKTKDNLKQSLENLNKTLAEFSEAAKTANTLLTDNKSKIDHTLTNLDKVSTNFAVVSDSLKKANMGATIKNLEKTLAKVDGIMANLQAGKGSMGKMLNDEALYKNLAKTSKELELLLQDVRLYPTRYVNVSLFGKKNKPYVATTDSVSLKK